MRDIKRIFIHVSASDDSDDIGLAEIKHLHVAPKTEDIHWYGYDIKGRGWSDVGYHHIIRRDGTIEEGRPESRSGAHAKDHNSDSIAICWVGRDDMTDVQRDSLEVLILTKMSEYGLSADDVYGHYEVNSNKSCPNIDMDELRTRLKNEQTSKGDSVPDREENLPDGPSEEEIDITLEDIENQIIDD